MSRVKRGVTAKKRHKKILNLSKGYYGARNNVYRSSKQAVIKSHQYAYRDRKRKKRNFRKEWILKINAASRNQNISYSKLIYKLKANKININRKILSNLIKNNLNYFDLLIKKICF